MVHSLNFISLRGWRAVTSLENVYTPLKAKLGEQALALSHPLKAKLGEQALVLGKHWHHVCVKVNNLPENQVYSFYNLFGTCAVFADCADSKIYQSLWRPLAHLRASEQSSIMRNMSHNLHWNHFGFISLSLPISLDTQTKMNNTK